MKVLYDEVIELRNRLSPDGSGETYQEDHLLLDRVLDLIEEHLLIHSHKQEKLLELYKKLITVKDDMFSYCEVADDKYYGMAEIEDDLEQQIKEKENETKRN